MWIPHNLLSPLKAETPRPTIEASESATEERTFVVGFFLRNPVTRAWETDVIVSMIASSREIVLGGKPCTVDESANASGKLEEIIYTFPAAGALAALASAYRHVVSELDSKSLQFGRGVEIAGWRVADIAHGARWRCVPFRPSALMAEPTTEDAPPAFSEVLRLYREARCATGATWRLICAGAILDAAVEGRAPFSRDEKARGYVITMDMLVRSGALVAYPALKGAKAADLRDLAEPKRRALLAALAPQGEGEQSKRDAGDYHAEASLAALANLVDLVARDLVLATLRERGFLRAVEKAETPTLENV